MELIFDAALSEDVAEEDIRRMEREGDSEASRSFRRSADEIYEKTSPTKRGAAFSFLYRKFFRTLGHPDRVRAIIEELDEEKRLPSRCHLIRVIRPEEESAQLSEDGAQLGIRIRSASLLDPERCRYLLRHELTHILDILDPAFGSEPARPLSVVSPSEDSLFRDRYRTLWDLSVDGRLDRRGLVSPEIRESRAAEFQSLFPSLGGGAAERVFEALWSGPRPSDGELREMVKGAAALCAALRVVAEVPVGKETTFGPGSSCPLCRFPTFEWAETTEALSRFVTAEYGDWDPSQGICTQCANRYLFSADIIPKSTGESNLDKRRILDSSKISTGGN